MQIWHAPNDQISHIANADGERLQWTGVLGTGSTYTTSSRPASTTVYSFSQPDNKTRVEDNRLGPALGHQFPQTPSTGCGISADPDTLCASQYQANFFYVASLLH